MLGLLLLLACAGPSPEGDSAPPDVAHRLDDQLTFADLQAVGTHNSYHIETASHPAWRYTHRPLDEQLGLGVRQLELDLYWSDDLDDWEVYHVPLIDQGSNCATLADCACAMWSYSSTHPGHHPLLTLLEVRTAPPEDAEDFERQARAMEDAILSCWPRGRVLAPEEVQGGAASLKEAVEGPGWPTLGALRGRSAWLLHTGEDWRLPYTAGDTRLDDRLLWPDIDDPDHPMGVLHTYNDPDDPAIAEAVALGHLVRTRADADVEEAAAGDTTQRDLAFLSGAHFLSTDFPEPHPDSGYVVRIPEGTPSRCNPLRAVEGCRPEDIEDPALLQGR